MLSGLTNVNIELTSRCNKSCHMCGRRKIEREYPELAKWGDMDSEMVKNISRQIPKGILVQMHDNGEPLLFPRLGDALNLFKDNIRCLDTNGKLLVEKADEIIDNLETITISTFEGDEEAEEQYETVVEFMRLKGKQKPNVIIRCLGDTDYKFKYGMRKFLIANRQFHSPMGNFEYKKQPTIPEIGICINALSHLAIKRDGAVSMCVTFDPHQKGVIGNIKDNTLDELWNGDIRRLALENHISGHRERNPLCQSCNYWGCPTSTSFNLSIGGRYEG